MHKDNGIFLTSFICKKVQACLLQTKQHIQQSYKIQKFTTNAEIHYHMLVFAV